MATSVTVIAVSYNHEKYVEETLNSIRDQTYKDFTLIIADNCSTDNSVERIKEWIKNNQSLRPQLVTFPVKQALCSMLNELLAMASGEYLQWISCDDVLLPEKIERHRSMLNQAGQQYAVVFSDAQLMGPNSELFYGKFIQRVRPSLLDVPSGNIFRTLLEEGNFLPAMTCLIRRKCLLEAGGYDETLSYEDYDMWLKISKAYKFLFDPDISANYRILNSGLNNQINYKIDNFNIWIKYASIEDKIVIGRLIRTLKIMYKKRHPKCIKYYKSFESKFYPLFGFELCFKMRAPFIFYQWFSSLGTGKNNSSD